MSDIRVLAKETLTWLEPRVVDGTVPQAHHYELSKRIAPILWDYHFDGPWPPDVRDGHGALMEAMGTSDAEYSRFLVIHKQIPGPQLLDLPWNLSLEALLAGLRLIAAPVRVDTSVEDTPPAPEARRELPSNEADARSLTATEAVEQWEGASKATKRANRITGVGRDWASFWRGFCEKHGVRTRRARKKDGTLVTHRREVELGSLIRTILKHENEFERATPESEKRRQAIRAKIEREHGLTPELLEELRAPE